RNAAAERKSCHGHGPSLPKGRFAINRDFGLVQWWAANSKKSSRRPEEAVQAQRDGHSPLPIRSEEWTGDEVDSRVRSAIKYWRSQPERVCHSLPETEPRVSLAHADGMVA